MAIDPKTGIDRSAIDAFNAQSLANAQKNYQWTNTYQATPLPTPPVTATPPKRMLTIPKEWDLATSPILPPAPTVPAPTVANPATGDLAAMIAKDKADYEASQKPKPTVATAQNPVVVRARQDKEAFSIPQSQDIINMDKNSVYDYMDRLEIKLNKWQALSDQEQLSLRALKRREAELTKPQPIEVLNDLAIQQQKEIGATEQQLKEQDAKDLQAFAQSQDAYKQAQLAVIDQAGEESIKTLGYILGAQWTATSTSGAEAINKIRQNVALQKQAKIAEVQANIDLKESQLRKDSQETINKMKDRLYNTQLESAKYDVMNIQALNEYNASEAKSNIEKLDALDAMSQSIIANNRPLTEAEMQQSQARSESLVKPDGSIDTTLFTILKETNPILAGKALQQSVEKMKKRLAIEDSKDLLDMQKVQAEINKLNAEWVGTWSPTKLEDWSVVLVNGKTGETRWVTANTWATVIDTIKKFEWFRDKAYQDSTGTWTIGYWFTNVNWAPVQPWMTMDRWTADSLLQQEISQRQNFMNYITVPLSESQKAALSSFEFNLWSGIREKNAKPILDKINAGDLQGAGNLMKQYTTSKWQQLKGLVNRRNEEASLLQKWPESDYVDLNKPSWTRNLPAGNASEIWAMKTAIDQTSNLGAIIDTYKDSMWPIAGNIWKINKFDTNAQTATAEFDRITQIIGKSLEWGKLAEWDIKRYLQMLPNITDKPDVARNKLASAQSYLNDLYAGQVRALWEAGYNVKSFYQWAKSQPAQSTTISPQNQSYLQSLWFN